MSALDVEALLDSAAAADRNNKDVHPAVERDDRHSRDRHERRDRDRARDGSRDRDRDRKRRDRSRDHARMSRDADSNHGSYRGSENGGADEDLKSPRSARGSGSRRHSRSRDRRRDRRHGDATVDNEDRNGHGDHHRGSRRPRTGSKSPEVDRYYRPADGRGSREGGERESDFRYDDRDHHREKRRESDRDRNRDRERDLHKSGRGRDNHPPEEATLKLRSKSPQLNEDERDRRTVFVQQLAARLRTKELIAFFEKVGPVKEAQIVKDRVSGRSKGVGYVEFRKEDSVPLAIQLTGQKLLGIPIIAQLTEAEKNRQAKSTEGSTISAGVPFHRLYVGNIHFSITESDLQNVFEPFGELEFVQLQKEEQGRSRGYGFVQFRDPTAAKEALEKMNGFDLAGRPIRVGLGNDKFTNESTQNLLQRFPAGQQPGGNFLGSSFSGSGGRGTHAGGNSNFDRAGGRDEKSAGGASALDDTDVAGVNFSNFSRDALMRKLARTDEPTESNNNDNRAAAVKPQVVPKPSPVNVPQASRCVVLSNMFDPAEEEGDNWVKELEDDVKAECTEKYGNVIHIALDPNSKGEIYVKFDRISGGENAIRGLNGRFFGGRQIAVKPVVDAIYNTYTRSRAL